MDEFGKFIEDCKVYRRAMDRMKVLGIRDEQRAIVYLQREIDHYRDKIRGMEEIARSNEGVKKNIHTADLFGRMPKDMASRISFLYMDSDGDVSVMFGTSEDHRAVKIKGSLESLKECMESFKDERIFSEEE